MTNKEILQANLLDIIFEHRNKNYGAYALRKNYPERLKWSVIIALALASLLFLITILKKSDSVSHNTGTEILLQDYTIDKLKDPEKQPQKTDKQVATVKASSVIQLTQNTNDVVDQTDFIDAQPSNETHSGTQPVLDTITQTTPVNNNPITETAQPEFHPSYENAAFPGGKEAFAQFLRDRLNTPDELEAGQKQTVLVRFMVDVDGTISKTEIVQSGSNSFDREVMRVLKKMPKWKPALQNGVKVAVYFTQLVTFVGDEQ
jgi:protein TonB